MRNIAIAAFAVVIIGAATAGAQSLGELTAATGINNTLNANSASSTSHTKSTILNHLGAAQGGSSVTGKGGWEQADAGHSPGKASGDGGRSGGWASARGGKTASTWARGGTPAQARRR